MKSILLASLVAASTFAGPAVQTTRSVLVWDDENPIGFVAKYNVYLVGETNVLLTSVFTNRWQIALQAGQHSIAVTAVSTNGLESEFSTNKTFTVLIIPSNLRIEQ